MDVLLQQIKDAKSRAYKLKTKSAQKRAWNKVRELEREALEILWAQRAIFATHSIKGTVRWFTSGDDHFCVDTPYGVVWVSPTTDALSKSWYSHTCCVEYTKGQEIVIEVEIDVHREGLSLEVVPRLVYGGVLNETKYQELCKQGNLAFFKYPDGRMSGLFA